MLIFLFLGLLTDSTVGSPAPILFIIQAQHGAFHTGCSSSKATRGAFIDIVFD